MENAVYRFSDEDFKTKPYPHQFHALTNYRQKDFAFLMEMGTGKTKVTIDNAYLLFREREINSLVVIAPKSVFMNWTAKEIPLHLTCDHVSYVWSAANTKKNHKAMVEITRTDYPDKLKVLAFNIEAFGNLKKCKAKDFLKWFLENNPKTMLVVDESTMIKNHKAKRTENLHELAPLAAYRRILTGSPVTNTPLDLYSQCYFLSPQLLKYPSYYAFRARYAIIEKINLRPIKDNTGRIIKQPTYPKVVKYQRLDELNAKLKLFSYRVTKEECLELPPKTFVTRNVELTPEQKKAYAEMKEMALVELESGEISSAMIAITKILRLHQIVCGHFKTDEGNVVTLPSNRIKVLLETIEEITGKVVIWANYVHDIKQIAEALSAEYGTESVGLFYGEISKEQRLKLNQNFQDRNNPVRFFVANTQTGATGIDLFQSHNVIYYSNNYKLEDRMQSEDRCHRIGQKNVVTYVDLVAPGTVDEKIISALKGKLELAQQITGDNYKDWIV